MSEKDSPRDRVREDQNSTDPAKGTRPSHDVLAEYPGGKGQTRLTRIGSAWEHKDKEGFTIITGPTPTNGKTILRSVKSRLEAQRAGKGGSKEHGDQDREA